MVTWLPHYFSLIGRLAPYPLIPTVFIASLYYNVPLILTSWTQSRIVEDRCRLDLRYPGLGLAERSTCCISWFECGLSSRADKGAMLKEENLHA